MATLLERIGQAQFSTIISLAGDDVFDVEKHKVIKHINSTQNPFSFHPTVIVADPFLFVHHNELHLFYEEQVDLTGKGVIKMTKSNDLKRWEKPRIVLEEEYHLSFPNVCSIDGQIYMIPETGNDQSVKLYKPNDDLTQWAFYRTLLSGRCFVDSSIVFFGHTYYLFTTDYTNKENVLRLYYADSIDGIWTEHPKSPIAKGADTGRCAGSLFMYKSKLYRPCQLTRNRYGEGTVIYMVETLSREEYIEFFFKDIIPNKNPNYKQGGHHFNMVEFRNRFIVASDASQIALNLIETSRRLYTKYFRKS